MNRKIIRALAALCFLTSYLPAAFAQEGGYLSQLSIAKGEKLAFYLSTSKTFFDLNIYRLSETKTLVRTFPMLPGSIQATPDSSYTLGCRWNKNAEMTIPDDWAAGVYEADLPTSVGIKPLVFVVREKIPGSYSKIVVNLCVNTWQAYNNWGGKSLYHFNSTDQVECPSLSFDRPFSDTTTAYYFKWPDKLVRWLAKEKILVEFCVSTDMDRDPEFMHHYQIYITVGHDEYWSLPERDECEHLLARGGKMIVLSGNTCWWQARIDDDGRRFVCFRDPNLDPEFPLRDSIVTALWSRPPISNPENKIIGVSSQAGGYVNSDLLFPADSGYGGYTVFNSHHWVYRNTGVKDGDVIGFEDRIVGYEVDGALYKWQEGIPVVTSEDSTPRSFRILGMSPAANSNNMRNGDATMGYYYTPGGGAVFNSSSINWVSGLDTNSVISQMLRNIIRQFSANQTLPPEIVAAEPVTVFPEYINHEDVFIANRTFPLNYTTNDTFAVHAADPIEKKLFYVWHIGGQALGTDSVLILRPDSKKLFPKGIVLEVSVSNGSDTVSMDWTLVSQASVRRTSDTFDRMKWYPNPFSERSQLLFTLEEKAHIEVEIMSIMGEHIRTLLFPVELFAGSHTLIWDLTRDNGEKVSGGIYFCRMTIAAASGKNLTMAEKLIVL